MTLGEIIKQRREKAKLTQADLAARVGLPVPRVSELENDRANPTLDTLRLYAGALNVPLWKLFKSFHEPPKRAG